LHRLRSVGTADAMTPFLTAQTALVSLDVYCVVHSFVFLFGTFCIYRHLCAGPGGRMVLPPDSPLRTGRCRSPIRDAAA